MTTAAKFPHQIPQSLVAERLDDGYLLEVGRKAYFGQYVKDAPSDMPVGTIQFRLEQESLQCWRVPRSRIIPWLHTLVFLAAVSGFVAGLFLTFQEEDARYLALMFGAPIVGAAIMASLGSYNTKKVFIRINS
jgi:hypothetical protein